MLKIADLGHGGQGLSDGHAGNGTTIKNLFGAVRDEMDARNTATIASPDASDLGTAITLVNEIKGALNDASSASKTFEK